MKKLLLPFLLVLLVLPVMAQASVLTFSAERGEVFYIKLNGRTINHRASNYVRINHLQPGRHLVEVSVRSRRGVYRMGQRVLVPNGVEANYGVRTRGRRAYLHLIREVRVVPPPVVVTPVPPLPRYDESYEDYGRQNRREPQPPRYEDNNCRNLLTAQELDRVIQAMNSREFDNTKLTIAREAVRSGSIMAEDLRRLLQQFEYESNQVEFAKFAYDYLCDREHFYYVYDVFRFDSNVEELERYSNSRR
ncbi:DUF4476 domain-containing protein [Pontibacter pamirensis]|uniref:DUF4476 domain-containing protein n=1 Tax=Pontibacter pamirensis TaxID=2562824 RepID=UPI001389D7E5|nr:DUF4476 domain-containing protein [Pontibacter pamirensis]